ncbi:BrnA antitoxin family protein [Bradyrhizobium sp.]|uniref:BrnA antitoxin family protein n=1 Tax=Bradyrhizobium sp. TaxID=376 RepID=UPI0032C23A77
MDAFKCSGEGWQTRMNGILRAAILLVRKPLQKDNGKPKRRRAGGYRAPTRSVARTNPSSCESCRI